MITSVGSRWESSEGLNEMQSWLAENCGPDGWVMTPAGLRGVVNDALAIYFLDVTLAGAFAARWRTGSKVEMAVGALMLGLASRLFIRRKGACGQIPLGSAAASL